MQTNTVQLHKKIKYLLDQSNSPRYRIDQISEAINDAIGIVMTNRFKPESPQDTQAGLQRNRILRDELRPLVKVVSTADRDYAQMSKVGATSNFLFRAKHYYMIDDYGTLTPTEIAALIAIGAPYENVASADVITKDVEFEVYADQIVEVSSVGFVATESPIAIKFDSIENVLLSDYFPSDYNYLALLRIIVSGVTADPFEITYEQIATVMQDPYSRPSIDMPPRTYHFESNDGYKFLTGDRGIITEVQMYYLAKPRKVYYGKEKKILTPTAGTEVILGQEVAEVTGNGFNEELMYGDSFIIPVNPLPQSTSVVTGTINSDMPESLVREIVSEAAKILLVTVENFNKAAQTK